ncbi:ABC-2 transporter permease [Peptacetobacter sp.]|uniref:ABC-2 transporter permease n=1 Tax=Peptacetobacter sp. TaxID=2991975 RepID=UPI00261A38D9|nr:ABC-2 transporter permease [Peptacetobacter sp.]
MKNILKLTKMSLYNLNSIKKMMIWAIGFIVVAALLSDGESESIYFVMLINIMGYIFTYMIMAYENLSDIDILISYIPINKKDFVKSRYLLGIIGVIVGVSLYFLVHLIKSRFSINFFEFRYMLELASVGILSTVFSMAIIIPANLAFDGIKSRIISLIGFMIPISVSTAIEDIVNFTGTYIKSFSFSMILISFIIILVSYNISYIVYNRKESI